MSHFTVLIPVLPKDGETLNVHTAAERLDKILEPYYEQHDEDSPYMEFNDKTDEVNVEWETGTTTRIRLADGSLHYRHDDIFKKADPKDILKREYVYPDDSEEVDVPIKSVYASIDEFVENYHGYQKVDEKYGYYRNPQAKWDWWEIGGRWNGFFSIVTGATKCMDCGHLHKGRVTVCDGCGSEKLEYFTIQPDEYMKGTPGTVGEKDNHDLHCDGAKAMYIDWEYKLRRRITERVQLMEKVQKFKDHWEPAPYELAEKVVAEQGYDATRWQRDEGGVYVWPVIRALDAEFPEDSTAELPENAEKLREWYRKYRTLERMMAEDGLHIWGVNDLDDIMTTNPQKIDMEIRGECPVYSFIDAEGKWHQEGEMGWWGVDDKTQATPNFDETFWDMVLSIQPDAYLFVVDCHI